MKAEGESRRAGDQRRAKMMSRGVSREGTRPARVQGRCELREAAAAHRP